MLCAIVVGLVQGVKAPRIGGEFVATLTKLRFAFLTGAAFAFLSPILGWLGTAVTGSDTSANALFATLQQSAAEQAGLDRPSWWPPTPPVVWSAR